MGASRNQASDALALQAEEAQPRISTRRRRACRSQDASRSHRWTGRSAGTGAVA